MKRQIKPDLTPVKFPESLKWERTHAPQSLKELCDVVNAECTEAINWYFEKKRRKKYFGLMSRMGAIVATAIAGLIPIIVEITKPTTAQSSISPAWSTVALAFVALFISLDKFGGWTTGWIRYAKAGMQLSQLQSNFKLKWEPQLILLASNPGDPELLKEAISQLKTFLESVHEVVKKETDLWIQEFQGVLKEIENGGKT